MVRTLLEILPARQRADLGKQQRRQKKGDRDLGRVLCLSAACTHSMYSSSQRCQMERTYPLPFLREQLVRSCQVAVQQHQDDRDGRLCGQTCVARVNVVLRLKARVLACGRAD